MSSLFNLASATVGGGHQARAGGYKMQRSVRLRGSAGYLNRTLGASGSTTQWTFSAWVKRGTLGTLTTIFSSCITGATYYQSVLAFDSSDRLWYYQYSNASNYTVNVTSTAVFRDPSAWYHVVMKFDANTSSMIVWVNNQQVINSSSFSTTYRYINSNNVHYIGNYAYQTVDPGKYDGYIAEVNFIDGQVLTPSSFGETDPYTGVWRAKRYTGTYGTNGFYLNFSDNSAATAAAIGKDYSGNGNNWTPNNISVTPGVTYDSMLDVPTQWADAGNGRGNYAVLNPLSNDSTNTLSAGNLNYSIAANQSGYPTSTFQFDSGKWYWECTVTSTHNVVGIALGTTGTTTTLFTTGYGYYGVTGNKYVNGTSSAYGTSFTTNDVIGIAVDMSNLTIEFFKNGVSQGTISIAAGLYKISGGNGNSVATATGVFNFGQRPFSYTPPSGFKALNTLNLPTPTILKGNQYFDATTYTGNSATLSVVNAGGFQPDLVWGKARAAAVDNGLYDSVRGVSKRISSNLTGAEITDSGVTSFNSNGFTLGSSTSMNDPNPYVGWQWKKGATQGFDIVTFTNTASSASFNHSLGVMPAMIILKGRGPTAANWTVFHKSLANMTSAYLNLNGTGATGTLATAVPAPTSTTFGSSSAAIPASESSIAYLFSEVAGFSKFGSYTGNGSANGPFVFCGFRPRWILTKAASGATGSWWLYDTARSTYNEMTDLLRPDLSNADTTQGFCDALSNGFKIRNSGNNNNGATYIFAAFAEHPFKNALAR